MEPVLRVTFGTVKVTLGNSFKVAWVFPDFRGYAGHKEKCPGNLSHVGCLTFRIKRYRKGLFCQRGSRNLGVPLGKPKRVWLWPFGEKIRGRTIGGLDARFFVAPKRVLLTAVKALWGKTG